jgi:hypothetical protein
MTSRLRGTIGAAWTCSIQITRDFRAEREQEVFAASSARQHGRWSSDPGIRLHSAVRSRRVLYLRNAPRRVWTVSQHGLLRQMLASSGTGRHFHLHSIRHKSLPEWMHSGFSGQDRVGPFSKPAMVTCQFQGAMLPLNLKSMSLVDSVEPGGSVEIRLRMYPRGRREFRQSCLPEPPCILRQGFCMLLQGCWQSSPD